MVAPLGADAVQSGYVVGEQVTLSTIPAPALASYAWSIAKPGGSTILSDLTDGALAAPAFTPDVAGFYVISVTVNGTTTYVLRCSVTATVMVTVAESIRVPPKADAGVIAPPAGVVLFQSLALGRLRFKNSVGVVYDLATPAAMMIGAALTDADVHIDVGGLGIRFLPPATLTGNHTCTLDVVGAVTTDMILVSRLDTTAWSYSLIDGGPGGATMFVLPPSESWWALCYFAGTGWLPLAAGQMP
jgi:hypothetical protein